MRLEMHVHTKYSKDSIQPFCFLYLMCKFREINAIAITDHNTVAGGIEFRKYCEKKAYKIKVIVGSEIMTNEGEIIGLFLNDDIEPGMSAEDTVKEIKQQGGVVYVPHPYDEKRKKTVLKKEAIARIKEDIDCIECCNGRNISSDYTIQQELTCNEVGKIKVIGSDAHTFFEIGRNYMELDDDSIEIDDKKGYISFIDRAQISKSPCIKCAHTVTKFVKIIKLIGNGEIYEVCRIINKRIRRAK